MRSHVLTLSEENGYYRTSRQSGLRNAYKLEDLLWTKFELLKVISSQYTKNDSTFEFRCSWTTMKLRNENISECTCTVHKVIPCVMFQLNNETFLLLSSAKKSQPLKQMHSIIQFVEVFHIHLAWFLCSRIQKFYVFRFRRTGYETIQLLPLNIFLTGISCETVSSNRLWILVLVIIS